MSSLRFGVAALALALSVGAASAQTTSPAAPGAADQPARGTSSQATNPPLPGANSFTEKQAADRIAEAGYQEVKNLKKDDQGVWRGIAKKGDSQVNIALDYRGNVVQE
jgi:hypothetical protein